MSDELLGRGEEDTSKGRYPTYLRAKGNVSAHSSVHGHDVAARWHVLCLRVSQGAARRALASLAGEVQEAERAGGT
eukprot:6206656-Pleurochrysis_carterae.AAC.1